MLHAFISKSGRSQHLPEITKLRETRCKHILETLWITTRRKDYSPDCARNFLETSGDS